MVQQAKQARQPKEPRKPIVIETLPTAQALEVTVVGIDKSLADVVREAEVLEVVDAMSHERATELLVRMKKALNDAEVQRKKSKDPYRKAAEAIDAAFSHATASTDLAYKDLNVRATGWAVTEEDRRARVLAAQREAEQAIQRAASAAAEEKGLPAPTVIPKQAPAPVETHVSVQGGSSTLVRRWTYDVIDENTLRSARPELFELSAKRTQALVNSGVRECPGLRIYQSATTATRA